MVCEITTNTWSQMTDKCQWELVRLKHLAAPSAKLLLKASVMFKRKDK